MLTLARGHSPSPTPFWCLRQKLSLSLLYFNKTLLHKSSEQSSLISGPWLNSSHPEAKNPGIFYGSVTTFQYYKLEYQKSFTEKVTCMKGFDIMGYPGYLPDSQENCRKKSPGRKHSKGKILSYGNPCLFHKEQRTLWLEVGKWERVRMRDEGENRNRCWMLSGAILRVSFEPLKSLEVYTWKNQRKWFYLHQGIIYASVQGHQIKC